MKVGDIVTAPALGSVQHRVVEVTEDGMVKFVTYLWEHDFPISDEEKTRRREILEGKWVG